MYRCPFSGLSCLDVNFLLYSFMFLAPAAFSRSYRVSISLQRLLSVRTTFVTSVMMGSASSSGTFAKKWLAIGP